MDLHRDTRESLYHIVDDEEKGISHLEYRIDKLEAYLSPRLLLSRPLTIVQSMEDSVGHLQKFDKIIGISGPTYIDLMIHIQDIFHIKHSSNEIRTHMKNSTQ